MADKNTILALNLGSQRVSMARFQIGKKGALTLREYATDELPGDVTSDSGRVGFLAPIIKGLAKQLKTSVNEEVIYAVPSQNVITRPVKLPALGGDQADKIVGYEAQQAVPFPLSETVWDYQIVSQDGPESEVLIAAIRSEQLEEINDAVEAAGLKPILADAAPFALYNAFRYNYGVPEQSTLLLDMGARTTDAIFMEGEKVFIASFPNAGGHVTQAISREMGADYDDAESHKKDTGFVNLGGNYADHEDPQVDAMSKIIRNQFTRLHAEINRRVQQYRQNGGNPPTHIYLAGGASALPYTKEFFEEKFRIPVEWFSGLVNVPHGNKVSAEVANSSGHVSGEIVGLALRANNRKQPLNLDLSPRSVDAAKDLASKKPKLFLGAVLLLGSLVGWWLMNTAKTKAYEADLAKLTKEYGELKVHKDAISAQETRGEKAKAWSEHLTNALAGRQYWLNMLNAMNKQLDSDSLWLTQISPLDPEGNPVTDNLEARSPGSSTGSSKWEQLSVTLDGLGLATNTIKAKPGTPDDTVVDSILVAGLWRSDNQEAPKDLFLKFKDLKDYFEVPDDWEKTPDKYLKSNFAESQNRHAASFQMRLRLKNKLKAKLLPDRK